LSLIVTNGKSMNIIPSRNESLFIRMSIFPLLQFSKYGRRKEPIQETMTRLKGAAKGEPDNARLFKFHAQLVSSTDKEGSQMGQIRHVPHQQERFLRLFLQPPQLYLNLFSTGKFFDRFYGNTVIEAFGHNLGRFQCTPVGAAYNPVDPAIDDVPQTAGDTLGLLPPFFREHTIAVTSHSLLPDVYRNSMPHQIQIRIHGHPPLKSSNIASIAHAVHRIIILFYPSGLSVGDDNPEFHIGQSTIKKPEIAVDLSAVQDFDGQLHIVRTEEPEITGIDRNVGSYG
jgi:hypothetical protein